MRITSGEYRGRTLTVPATGDVRPTQDRVREALFSMIQSEIAGSDFLDLFAGTGSAGIEALSRGAASATFVEVSARHLKSLEANIAKICVGRRTTVLRFDVYRWIERYSGGGFSIVFADPPYALGEEKGYASVLKTLSGRGVVREGGLFIAEMTAVQKAEETPGWELVRDRCYGKTRLCIWRRAAAGAQNA